MRKILDKSMDERFLLAALILLPTLVFRVVIDAAFNNGDEFFTWWIVRQPTEEILLIAGDDVHPPLYFVVASAWAHWWNGSLASLRLLSMVLGVAWPLLLSMLVASVLRNEGVSCSARYWAMGLVGGLAATNLPAISASQYARMYALMSLLAVVSFWCLWIAIHNPKRTGAWLLFVLSSAALVWTHNYGLFFLCGEALWLVGELWRGALGNRIRIWTSATVCFTLVGLSYLPWLPVLIRQSLEVSGGYWIGDIGVTFPAHLSMSFFLPVEGYPGVGLAITVMLSLLTLGLLIPYRNGTLERFLLAQFLVHIAAVLAARLLLGTSIFVPRYLACLLPFVLAVVGVRIAKIPLHLRVTGVAFLVVNSVGVFMAWQYFAKHEPQEANELHAERLNDFAELHRRLSTDNTCLVFTEPYDLVRYRVYADGRGANPWLWNPKVSAVNGKRHVPFLACVHTSRRLTEELAADLPCKSIWVIESRSPGDRVMPRSWLLALETPLETAFGRLLVRYEKAQLGLDSDRATSPD